MLALDIQSILNSIPHEISYSHCFVFRIERKPLIKFGIGLHTGQLVAGSVGGSRRLNYSVIGDAVNVAARLEAMNKEIVSDIAILNDCLCTSVLMNFG
jgi:Adenylate and Guanylate cyclase catalytic domain